ncbi:DUF4097 family beta strand repeat-containing protein [Nibricoccus sp. IMCC34717]|uniref:DUF4097 family beta strand repeat-containing protein n=1 Tax=Nibricoccus sp. IMCC34717 TaxID=3034021 RepID=UPI00384F96A6
MKSLFSLLLGSVLAAQAFAGVSDTIENRHALAADASVLVVNTNGSITVTSWDKPEIEVIATRKAKNQEALAKIEVKFEATDQQVKVRTESPTRYNSNTSVDYVIRVPATVKIQKLHETNGDVRVSGISGPVTVGTVNGRVELNDVTGAIAVESVNGDIAIARAGSSVKAQTVNGSIHMQVAQLGSGAQLHAETVNGSVTVALPANSSATLSANTRNGGVSNDLGLPKAKRSFGGTSFEGTLGSGAAKVEVETVNGSVDFTKA